MSDFEASLILPTSTIRDALVRIEKCEAKIVLVVDETRRLLGTVTDGDTRRGLLRGLDIHALVTEVMNAEPKSFHRGASQHEILEFMRRHVLRHMPIIDERGRVVGLETLAELMQPPHHDNWVVVMAGGRGTRLRRRSEE